MPEAIIGSEVFARILAKAGLDPSDLVSESGGRIFNGVIGPRPYAPVTLYLKSFGPNQASDQSAYFYERPFTGANDNTVEHILEFGFTGSLARFDEPMVKVGLHLMQPSHSFLRPFHSLEHSSGPY